MDRPKFIKGDLVQIAKDLGAFMGHFTSDRRAIVIEEDDLEYGLYIEGEGEAWWYDEDQLTLIESDRRDLLTEWKREK